MELFGEQVGLAELPLWLSSDEREAALAASKSDDGFSKWHRVQLILLELQSVYFDHPLVESIAFELCGPMSLPHRQVMRAFPRISGGQPYHSTASMGVGPIEAKLDGLIDRHWPERLRVELGAISTRKDPLSAVGRALMGPEPFEYWIGSQLSRDTKHALEGSTPRALPASESTPLRL